MLFLCTYCGEKITELLEWNLKDLIFWYGQAVGLHNKLNPESDS